MQISPRTPVTEDRSLWAHSQLAGESREPQEQSMSSPFQKKQPPVRGKKQLPEQVSLSIWEN